MFGYTEEQIAWFGLTFGVTAFMLYMVFIIFQLARESRAGRFGTFVLFLGLGVGLLGFAAKGLIKFFIAGIVE
jgi:small-conductance mechanosensitive channel